MLETVISGHGSADARDVVGVGVGVGTWLDVPEGVRVRVGERLCVPELACVPVCNCEPVWLAVMDGVLDVDTACVPVPVGVLPGVPVSDCEDNWDGVPDIEAGIVKVWEGVPVATAVFVFDGVDDNDEDGT